MRRNPAPLVLLVCVGVALVGWRPLRALTLAILRLPLTALNTVINVSVLLPQLPHLASDNVALRNELATKQLELIRWREAVRHASRTEELTRTAPERPSLVASIIGRTTDASDQMILIDKGSRDGVTAAAILLDTRGLVGRVFEVYPRTSAALLLTDPDSRVACLVDRSRELGLLVGTGGALCRLIHLDVDADISVDDEIVTAGLEGPFPKGLIVGIVVRIVRDEPAATTSAWVKPSVNLRQLEELLCLLPPSGS